MTPDQLKAAAQVMLDAAKPGAVVEYAHRGLVIPDWSVSHNPVWDWQLFDYRVTATKHTTLDDLPPVCWVREVGSGISRLVAGAAVGGDGDTIQVDGEWNSLRSLRGTHEYSSDRKTWTPFS